MKILTSIIFVFFSFFCYSATITVEVRSAFDNTSFSNASILICNLFDEVQDEIFLNDQGIAKIEFKRSVYFKIKSNDDDYFGGTYRFNKKENGEHKIVYVFPNSTLEKRVEDEKDCNGLKEAIVAENSILENNNVIISEASFPGGPRSLSQYLFNSIIYPEESLINGEEGKVFISFIVDKEGLVKCPQILRGVSKWIDAEVMRVIRFMPNWNPGTSGGDPITVVARIPINLSLR